MYVGEARIIHDHKKNRFKSKAYVVQNKMLSDLKFCKKYLNCTIKEMLPLIIYYRIAYNLFCIKDREFRKNRTDFYNKINTVINS